MRNTVTPCALRHSCRCVGSERSSGRIALNEYRQPIPDQQRVILTLRRPAPSFEARLRRAPQGEAGQAPGRTGPGLEGHAASHPG